MVTLRMVTASCGANTSGNGMAWQGKSCCTHFCHLDLRNTMMQLASSDSNMAPMALHDQKSFCTSLWSSGHNKCNCAIDNAISFMWFWCWCQWCHMTKEVMLHFILIILTLGNVIMPSTMLFASHDADASASGIIWPIKSCCTSLLSFGLKI